MEEYLLHGAAVICVEYDQPDATFSVLDYESNTNHIQLVRLVVFPDGES